MIKVSPTLIMKSNSAVLICALVVGTFAISSNAQEWPLVLQKVNEIKEIITGAITKIKTTVEKDNPEAAKKLIPKIDDAISKASDVLDKTVAALDSRSLTEEQGKKLFEELKQEMLEVQASAQEDMAKLSNEAVTEVRVTFVTAYSQATRAASEAFSRLSQNKNKK